MNKWKNQVLQELNHQHLFQNGDHMSRFKELLDCYADAPFFTHGLCKCMYLSCWDEEHFSIMLDMLNQLSFSKNINLNDMNENGELMAEEAGENNYDQYVLQLSCAFLMDKPFDLNTLPKDLDEKGLYIIKKALQAANIIDGML